MEPEGWIPGKEGRDPCPCWNAVVNPHDFVVDLVALGVFLTPQI